MSVSSPTGRVRFEIRLSDGSVHGVASGSPDADEPVSIFSAAAGVPLRREPPADGDLVVAGVREAGPRGRPRIDVAPLILDRSDSEGTFLLLATLSAAVARRIEASGGFLLHAALAAFGGKGVVFPARGGTGKTTVSSRLVPPWESLSDDACVVVRSAEGNLRAHPWPTWSRFLYGGDGGRWEVERSVPVAGIFFLEQSPEDVADPIGSAAAAVRLSEAQEQASILASRFVAPETARADRVRRFEAGCLVARSVPAFRLRFTKEGDFPSRIEKALRFAGR